MAAVFGILMTVAAAVVAIGIVLYLERGFNMVKDGWSGRGEYHSED